MLSLRSKTKSTTNNLYEQLHGVPAPEVKIESCFDAVLNQPKGLDYIKSHLADIQQLKDGLSLLHYAIIYCRDDIVTYLVEELKFDVNVQTPKKKTAPLHLLAMQNRADLIELLVQHRAKIDIQNANGETPLHEAAKCLRYEAIEMLLFHDVKVYKRRVNGFTPLHYVVGVDFGDLLYARTASASGNPNYFYRKSQMLSSSETIKYSEYPGDSDSKDINFDVSYNNSLEQRVKIIDFINGENQIDLDIKVPSGTGHIDLTEHALNSAGFLGGYLVVEKLDKIRQQRALKPSNEVSLKKTSPTPSLI